MKILFLGRLADVAGERERTFDPPPGLTDIDTLRNWLGEQIPALLDPSVRVIVNDVLAHPGQTVAADDEVAFFPPVSGG